MDHRTERVLLETERYRVTGTITLPRDGYRSRLSDFLNRGDLDFIPLINVEIRSTNGGGTEAREFLAVARPHIQLAYQHKAE